jgi:RimJ/RimL family protein N-acetyltransferase
VSISFFVREGLDPRAAERALPQGMTWQVWRPAEGPLSIHPFDPLRWAVSLQHKLGLFDDDRYTELSIWCAAVRVHRLIVTPRWHRFPFMAPGDLQIGGLWTHPAWRGSGLARLAIDRAHRLCAAPGQRFWYVTDSANAASIALAHSAGYRRVGEGRRTKPVGIALLGRFELERECAVA